MATSTPQNLPRAIVASLYQRRRVLLAGVILTALAWIGGGVWRVSRAPLRNESRYQIVAANVKISSPPPWVRVDIRGHAIDRATIQSPLTVIDPEQATARIAEAFRLEPWVRKVERVELQAPNQAFVDLQWREPIAVVQCSTDAGVSLMPLDADSVRLPAQGLQDGELRRMPRIADIHAAPPLGESWYDPQVIGAVQLIQQFGPEWSRLSLAVVRPVQLEIRDEQQFYRYEIETIGGTRIVWGAAPDVPCEEPPFSAKLGRLKQFVAEHQFELDKRKSPEIIDLRNGLQAKPRIAKKDEPTRTAQRATKAGADDAKAEADIVK